MDLQLDTGQAVLLHEVLESALREMTYEIADTDNSVFKRQLKDRRRVLRSILESIPATEPAHVAHS